MWTTGFFDKNIVGTANALAGGFGSAGGGITYFIMPAVYDSFVAKGYTVGQAWRLTFVVPLVMVIAVAVALLSLCPDTPTGSWNERHRVVHGDSSENVDGAAVDVPGGITDRLPASALPVQGHNEKKEKDEETAVSTPITVDPEAQTIKPALLLSPTDEIVSTPTLSQSLRVAFSPQTAFHLLSYMNSFGAELAINVILSSYYFQTFPGLSQTDAATHAAVFGFLDFGTRPLGGVVSDLLYKYSGHNLWFKKGWMVVCGLTAGALLIVLGQVRPREESAVFGLVALVAVFLQAGNGANFALVPHVHPSANGILSGLTGAGGNLGGIIFSVVFRFMGDGTDYGKGFWVIGVIHVAISLAMSPIPPLPRGQIGGR